MVRPIRSLSVVNIKIKCERIYAKWPSLYHLFDCTDIWWFISKTVWPWKEWQVFCYYTPKIRAYSGKETEIWVPIDFLSTESREYKFALDIVAKMPGRFLKKKLQTDGLCSTPSKIIPTLNTLELQTLLQKYSSQHELLFPIYQSTATAQYSHLWIKC